MIIQIGTEVDESRILWKHKESDEWKRADIDDLIEAYENRQKEPKPGDLISRQDALKPFCIAPDGTRIPEVDCDNFPVEFSVKFIKRHLLSLPSSGPDCPRGEWVKATGVAPPEYAGRYVCSNCGYYAKVGDSE